MRELFEENKIRLEFQDETEIPVGLENWMSLSKTYSEAKAKIRAMMKADLDGNQATGFKPYLENGEIFFNHHWMLNMGRVYRYSIILMTPRGISGCDRMSRNVLCHNRASSNHRDISVFASFTYCSLLMSSVSPFLNLSKVSIFSSKKIMMKVSTFE